MTPEELISLSTGTPFRATNTSAVGGGCINRAFVLSDGERSYFLKRNQSAFLRFFDAESDALRLISRTNTLRVPEPIGSGGDTLGAYLVLEFLPMRTLDHAGQQELGRGLARMHRHTRPCFGWEIDNAIGATPQRNAVCDSWVEFFAEHRLRFQFEVAARNGFPIPNCMRLVDRLPDLLGGHEPQASLLHGDLWGGNAAMIAQNLPVVFDPATYYGDRETDLAMTNLFGGFSPEFRGAYQEEYPLPEGANERELIYNLYHILNHLNLFGGGYAEEAARNTAALLGRV